MDRSLTPEQIDEIYASAIEPGRWGEFASLLAGATGLEAVGVWIVDNAQLAEISLSRAMSLSEAPYVEHFHKIDPWQRALSRAPMGSVFISNEHVAEDELVKGEFYNDFARHHGLIRPMGALMPLAPGVIASIAGEMPFASRLFEAEDKSRLGRVLPYVKNALQFRQRNRGSLAWAGFGLAALEALTFGVVICDRAGRIVVANVAAENMARRGVASSLSAGSRQRSAPCAAIRPGSLAALISTAGSGGPGGAMMLATGEGEGLIAALVSPLPPSLDEAGVRGRVMVSLRAMRGDLSVAAGAIAALYRLSPRQADVAALLCDGFAPAEIARQLGMKITTLRSHLAAVFLKTGAENQRELVRMLHRLPPVALRWTAPDDGGQ